MEPGPVFPTDLFRGTAPYDDKYRPPYPPALFDDLCRRLPVSGAGDLLDVACGTGQVALPLCHRFVRVVAVDQEEEFVVYGRAKAERLDLGNVEWVTGAAETVPVRVDPGGGVALVWGETPHRGDRDWRRAIAEVLEAWTAKLGVVNRGPAGWEEHMDRDPSEQVLGRAGAFQRSATYAYQLARKPA